MINDLASYPRRIVCLTEETTETLYLLGQQERVGGGEERARELVSNLQSELDAIAGSALGLPAL